VKPAYMQSSEKERDDDHPHCFESIEKTRGAGGAAAFR